LGQAIVFALCRPDPAWSLAVIARLYQTSCVLAAVTLLAGCAASPPAPITGRDPGVVPVAADHPDQAFEWKQQIWRDENGVIDPRAYHRARAQRAANVAASASLALDGTAGLAPENWVERGPFNVMGRTRSLIVSPLDPQRMWSGSVSGGIWMSERSGLDWVPINDNMKSIAIGCMAIDPLDPTVMYAGTGEGFFNGDAIGGNGIFRSVDGGLTWEQIPSTDGWDNVCRIAISPVDSNLILAGKRYGGIMRSTDRGATWQNVQWAQGGFYVAFHPSDGSKAVAAVIDHDGDWFHRAYYSSDAGATWQVADGLSRIGGFGSRIELAYAPSNPEIVYASCAADGGKIWKSTDGGQSYVKQTGGSTTGVNWYANPLWVDPTNPDHLIAGGVHLYRSWDGGVSFSQLTNGYIMTDQPHPDMHGVISHPQFNGVTNRTVYVCTDGGVWVTYDINVAGTHGGWTPLDEDCRTSQFYGAAGHGPADMLLGGTQDNGTLRLVGDTGRAHLMFGGDGGFCAIDPTDSDYCYGEYINLQIHRSKNGGQSAYYIFDGIDDAGSAANFIAPFILDPNDPNTMLAGGRHLWRSNNVKSSPVAWASISPNNSSNISAIAVATGNPDIIWYGQNDGRVWRTENGTAADPVWIPVDRNWPENPLPNRYITRIVIDPDDHDTVYVALGGFSEDNLWKTTDSGLTFTDITGAGDTGIPAAPIRGLARHPERAGYLYVGTEVGIFASDDDGATWSSNNLGPASVSVDELVFMHHSNTLLAATHGRGMFTADVSLDCPGDVDGDGAVDIADLGILLAGYELPSNDPLFDARADLNGDGTVDIADLGILLAGYELPCP
jgi:photosystem II stability/assembly factor-like uncharacterized protein